MTPRVFVYPVRWTEAPHNYVECGMQTAMADRAIIAITTSGSVYAYGTTADGETFASVTRLQGLLNHKCRQITCGHSATFVLTSSGTLLAWGRCASGLLGTTSRASIFSPKLIKFVQPGVSPRELRMRSISAGMHHAAAVSDGARLPLSLQCTALPLNLRALACPCCLVLVVCICRHDALYLGRWRVWQTGPRQHGELL